MSVHHIYHKLHYLGTAWQMSQYPACMLNLLEKETSVEYHTIVLDGWKFQVVEYYT